MFIFKFTIHYVSECTQYSIPYWVHFETGWVANLVLYDVSQSNIDRLQHVQNVLARVVVQAPLTISSMDICHELHWLPVYYRISYKLSLLTLKALHTAEPSYLSELISPYAPTRTLHSVNTGLLVLPTSVTSHCLTFLFCFISISLEFSICTRPFYRWSLYI